MLLRDLVVHIIRWMLFQHQGGWLPVGIWYQCVDGMWDYHTTKLAPIKPEASSSTDKTTVCNWSSNNIHMRRLFVCCLNYLIYLERKLELLF
jgi:hypothetical protein